MEPGWRGNVQLHLYIRDMYDHQSQASSTHHKPFDKRFKKALRLNRDPVLFCARMTEYQELEGGFLVTVASKRTVVGAVLRLQ